MNADKLLSKVACGKAKRRSIALREASIKYIKGTGMNKLAANVKRKLK